MLLPQFSLETKTEPSVALVATFSLLRDGKTHGEILEEPRLEDASRRLGKYSSFTLHSTPI